MGNICDNCYETINTDDENIISKGKQLRGFVSGTNSGAEYEIFIHKICPQIEDNDDGCGACEDCMNGSGCEMFY